MELKAGIYKSTKSGKELVIAEDGRVLYAYWDGKAFGPREKWPNKYKNFQEFATAQKMTRTGDWNGVFF